jgi:diguanylate cyclase (GGDEF)-like protein
MRRLFFAAMLACARLVDAGAQQLPLRYLTQQDGLGNLTVNALAQDHTGYLWVGTDNGLFRYNGAEFQRYAKDEGLIDTRVSGLLADTHQSFWVGTFEGFYRLAGNRLVPVLHEGQPLPILPGQPLAATPSGAMLVSGERLYRLSERDGEIAIAPHFSEDQLRRRPVLADIHGIRIESDGRLWMGCGAAICVEGPEGLTVWDRSAGVPADRWFYITRAADGVVWARGRHHIVALDPGGSRFADRTPPGEAMRKVGVAGALVEDADHRMLSNTDHGVARWRSGRWEFFDARNGLKMGGGVPAMLVDRDQNLWLGTRGHGLVRWLGYDNWENWTTSQGLPDDMVFSFLRDGDGAMRIGTRSGMALLAAKGATRMTPDARHAAVQWSSLAADRGGSLWSGSYTGLLTRRDASGGAVRQVATLPMIFRLLPDREGRLWISTGEGLYVLEHPEAHLPPRLPAGLAAGSGLLNEQMGSSCQGKDGALWFLGEQALWRHWRGRWDSYLLREERKAGFDKMACAADGSLWLGRAASGLWRARVGEHGLTKSEQAAPLLRNKTVLSILEDSRGWLWLGTDSGLVAWNGRQWRQFNTNDGLVWDDFNARPMHEDRDGTIWLPTSNGTSHIVHPERLFAPQHLSAIVEAVARDGRPLQLREGESLAWSAGALEFAMASLSYQRRDGLRFRYRLAGLERDWSVTAVPRLRYAALPPGQYRLQYAVENLDSQSVSATRELGFTIEPPWWRTTAFYLLCAAAGLTALWWLYRSRVRALKARNAQMEGLVRDRTRELEDRTRELELSQEALRERALRDGLTRAWNRGAILEMLDQALLKSQRNGAPLLVILLDLDHFKQINDGHGHQAGDAVLREVVLRLNAGVRSYDLLGRYGGEEFLALLPDLDRAGGAGRVEAMRRAIEAEPIDIGEQRAIAVTASFGVAEYDPARPCAALELVRQADLALYRAKAQGRNRVAYAGDAAS